MCWLKNDLWKVGIAIVGMLLLPILMVWVPVSATSAYEGMSGLATPVTGTMQATPTVDATVVALNKEKLAQEVQQLKNQNATDLSGWIRMNAAILLSTLVVVIGGLIGLFRWLGDRLDEQKKRRDDRQAERESRDEEQKRWLDDRQAEREKRAEERFQTAVEGLGSEREEAKVGAAITLRTFLRPGYEQFYFQAFDLAVANLRLPRTSQPSEDPITPLPSTSLRQALIIIFKGAFPLVRDMEERNSHSLDIREREELDATNIQLDNADLAGADLKRVRMDFASLRSAQLSSASLVNAKISQAKMFNTVLFKADLSQAELIETDFTNALLCGAKLTGAYLRRASLRGAKLYSFDNIPGADLSGADLRETDLRGADLRETDLHGADLSRANLSKGKLFRSNKSHQTILIEAEHMGQVFGLPIRYDLIDPHLIDDEDIIRVDLSGANLSGAILNGTSLEDVLSLQGTDLRGVIGLTREQLAIYKAKGAIIDEVSTTSSSQSPISLSPPLQRNNVQAPLAPSAQGSIPTPDTHDSATSSSQQGLET